MLFVMKSFPELYREGEKRHDLTEDFFENAFSKVKVLLENKGVSLTGENFGGGGKQIQQQLAQIIIEAVMTV